MTIGGDNFILMYDGKIKIVSDIKIGDKLMSPTGKPHIVTNIVSDNMNTYYIVPVKGTPYSVSEDHDLMVKISYCANINWNTRYDTYIVEWYEGFSRMTKYFSIKTFNSKEKAYIAAQKFIENEISQNKKYTKSGDILNIIANKYYNLSKRMKSNYKGFSSGIDFKHKEIEFDPYIVGYWLGDGNSHDTGITTAETEIIEYFKNFAENNNMIFKKKINDKYIYYFSSGKSTGGHGRNPFLNFLKKNKMLKNKHIPIDYIHNSREIRLAILAGLIDSDGYWNGGGYDFIFKSEKLADSIIYLARSLGFKAFKNKCEKTCTNSSRGRVTGTYYRFCISGEGLEDIPCLLKRKTGKKRKQIKNPSVTGLTILESGVADCYKIETNLDAYLMLDDFTIIHK